MRAASQVLKLKLLAYDTDLPEIRYRGKRYARNIRSERKYYTLAGDIQITRTLYRNAPWTLKICPLDIKAGIVKSRWTPKASKLTTRKVAGVTPYAAESLLQEISGMTPSKSTLDRFAKSVDEQLNQYECEIAEYLHEHLTIPEEAVTLAVSLDWVHVPIQKLKGQSR